MFHMKGTKQNGVGPMPNGKISGLSGMAKGTMMLYIYLIFISVIKLYHNAVNISNNLKYL